MEHFALEVRLAVTAAPRVTMLRVEAKTRYAQSDGVNIAYQVTGSGPLDLVLVSGFVSHLEIDWAEPRSAHFLERLSSFARRHHEPRRRRNAERLGRTPVHELSGEPPPQRAHRST